MSGIREPEVADFAFVVFSCRLEPEPTCGREPVDDVLPTLEFFFHFAGLEDYGQAGTGSRRVAHDGVDEAASVEKLEKLAFDRRERSKNRAPKPGGVFYREGSRDGQRQGLLLDVLLRH